MAENKYYWLKLKRDFFKRHDIMIVESMPNGKEYALLYLKLLLESIDHDGMLRFNEAIPYSEQMISTITNTNIDVVRSAMKIFQQLKLIDIFDDETIFMSEVQKMLGTETSWAEKKRQYRLQKEDNVLNLSSSCPPVVRQEIEIEKDIEKELHKEKDKDKNIELASQVIEYLNEKSGHRFELAKATVSMINARAKEGHTLEDFQRVIKHKCAEWKSDAKLSKFIRPSTLFSPEHFPEYLAMSPKIIKYEFNEPEPYVDDSPKRLEAMDLSDLLN